MWHNGRRSAQLWECTVHRFLAWSLCSDRAFLREFFGLVGVLIHFSAFTRSFLAPGPPSRSFVFRCDGSGRFKRKESIINTSMMITICDPTGLERGLSYTSTRTKSTNAPSERAKSTAARSPTCSQRPHAHVYAALRYVRLNGGKKRGRGGGRKEKNTHTHTKWFVSTRAN